MVCPDPNVTFPIPNEGDVLIREGGDIPFIVTNVDNGKVIGQDPDGNDMLYPIECGLHELDAFDL